MHAGRHIVEHNYYILYVAEVLDYVNKTLIRNS